MVVPLASILGNILIVAHLYCVICLLCSSRFHMFGGFNLPLETAISSIHQTVKEQTNSDSYFTLLYSLFTTILVFNCLGNIPYSYTVTGSAVVCLGLSITVFIAVTILAFSIHRFHFLSFFVPNGTPLALVPLLVLIELVSYFSRSVSLGVRLFSNIVAGHTLLKILSTFILGFFKSGIIIAILTLIPFTLFLALIGLELAVSFIQAYVFVILVSSYVRDATDLH